MKYKDPFPPFSYLSKMISSIFKNLDIEYDYTKLKLLIYNSIGVKEQNDYFIKSLVDYFWYLHNHRNESGFDKRIVKACDLCLEISDEEKKDIVKLFRLNSPGSDYNMHDICKYISKIYMTDNHIVKIFSLITVHILIYNMFFVYYVLPPDFFVNCAVSLKSLEIKELSIYLKNRILSQIKTDDLDVGKISEYICTFMSSNKYSFIQSISLFGSFVDGSFNSQSDLDFLLITDESPSYVEVNTFCNTIKNYLMKKLNYHIDCIYDTDSSELKVNSKVIWRQKV